MYAKSSNIPEKPETRLTIDALWGLSEELLEHLEKFHEGKKDEHEIAVLTYWQLAATEADSISEKNPNTDQKPFQASPFTDIEKIPSWFPKKNNHPEEELPFFDKKTGSFPRESEGSNSIKEELKKQGL